MSTTPVRPGTTPAEEVEFVTDHLATYEDDKKDTVDALEALAKMQRNLKHPVPH
ncbi:hypothetical protein [Nevskia soli]|jgi:hypothetical protein|uniref:hypothetical protein n=1 Tax=Nevskia soli TaxID=418856 RepID=UPI0015D75A03|nr:hypothetical protein [Nevskia soli]